MDKKEAAVLVRDMVPYVDILKNIVRYFRSGEHIDVLEIGVRRGTSTKAILRGITERLGTGHLYSIDIDKRDDAVDSKLKENWDFIMGDSKSVGWDKPVDILFIDGDHTYNGVKADFEKFFPFVKEGGLVLMHDITNRDVGVKDYWREITYPKANIKLNGVGLGIINK